MASVFACFCRRRQLKLGTLDKGDSIMDCRPEELRDLERVAEGGNRIAAPFTLLWRYRMWPQ